LSNEKDKFGFRGTTDVYYYAEEEGIKTHQKPSKTIKKHQKASKSIKNILKIKKLENM
jgi:hypothetical protein